MYLLNFSLKMDEVSFETIKGISFAVYCNEEIRKLSVLEVTNTEILDCLDHPAQNGLHDLRLGKYFCHFVYISALVFI